ncbi:hypothetical protein [Wuhan arthropod virus 1]|uniref:hypothetical protein n=1 Tax=Wuhan arthropod virus 1 TaxID=1923690 RepID=UPI00090B4D83|nr:hypothetical protein [Wuhan arthropod virus 1]APG77756.1 hypothetical protein [Wuhan arthropod virus 1]
MRCLILIFCILFACCFDFNYTADQPSYILGGVEVTDCRFIANCTVSYQTLSQVNSSVTIVHNYTQFFVSSAVNVTTQVSVLIYRGLTDGQDYLYAGHWGGENFSAVCHDSEFYILWGNNRIASYKSLTTDNYYLLLKLPYTVDVSLNPACDICFILKKLIQQIKPYIVVTLEDYRTGFRYPFVATSEICENSDILAPYSHFTLDYEPDYFIPIFDPEIFHFNPAS